MVFRVASIPYHNNYDILLVWNFWQKIQGQCIIIIIIVALDNPPDKLKSECSVKKNLNKRVFQGFEKSSAKIPK